MDINNPNLIKEFNNLNNKLDEIYGILKDNFVPLEDPDSPLIYFKQLDSLGRLTLPIAFRRLLNINNNTELQLTIKGNSIIVTPKN